MIVLVVFLLIMLLCISIIVVKKEKKIRIISTIILIISIVINLIMGIKLYNSGKKHMSYDEVLEYNNKVEDVNMMIK